MRYNYVFGKIPIDPNVGWGVSLVLLVIALAIPNVRDVNPEET
jgi:hypothetical protein